MRGLYVHVPFCVRKCAYCDFYSLAAHQNLIDAYVDAVLIEAGTYEGCSFATLYFGGGTPGLLGASGLRRMVGGLRRRFDLTGLTEGTIEVNPDSASDAVLEAARTCGLDRISIGVQSLDDGELRGAGRIHTAAQAVDAIERAGEAGLANISGDVIIGLPGQTWRTLRQTLLTMVELGLTHVSAYCLSLEAGTPLADDPPADLPPDDAQADLFKRTCKFLDSRKFVHYEISNFAQAGFECRHNLNYWRGGDYLGLGPAAASHLGGKRRRNRADLKAYLADPTCLLGDEECLGPAEKAAEEAMLRLRLLSEGLDATLLRERFGAKQTVALRQRLDDMATNKELVRAGSQYRIASHRVLTSNPIFARVLGPNNSD